VADIALFGEVGAAIVAQSVRRLDWSVAGYLNDVLAPGTALPGGKVVGGFDAWPTLAQRVSFIAPLYKAKEMQRRAARIIGLGIPAKRWCSVIDPVAVIGEGAEVDGGSFVGPFCVVDVRARVGRHVGLWPAAQIGHDSVVEDFVFAGRAAIVSGRCHVGVGAHIGPGAVVKDGCRIGRFAVVGAGAVVIRDVPDHAVVAGNPAHAIGKLNPADDPPRAASTKA
jgi:sugar O-acyltransferase (sialic acid O-acetyltransferase NeuD family)